MPEKRSHELESAGGSTKSVRHDLPYQRAGPIDSGTKRHLGWFAVVVVALPTLVAVPTLLGVLDSAVLGMLSPVMAWIPTVILFGLHRLYRRDESFLTLAAIKPIRPVRPIIVTSLFVMVALCVLPVLTEALAILFGLKSVAVSSDAWALLPTVPLFVLAYAVLAAGEEFAWRGYIQTLLAPWGYWSSSAAIGAFWSLWHIPFSIGYMASGDMLVRDLASTSVNLFLAALSSAGSGISRHLSGPL